MQSPGAVNEASRALRTLRLWLEPLALCAVYLTALVVLLPSRPLDASHFAAVLFALLAPALVIGLSRLRFDAGTIAIVVAATGMYLGYLAHTGVSERNYDGPEELRYVALIAAGGRWPAPDACFVCHHPPLYYLLAAGVQRFFLKTRLAPFETGLQGFSLLLFLTFLIYSAALARRVSGNVRATRLATALVAFWPYSIHYSVRVHNDALIAPLLLAGLYHTVRWWHDERPRDLYLAALACALGLLTKSSALIAATVLGVVIAVRCWRGPRRHLAQIAVALAIVAAGGVLNVRWKASMPAQGHGTLCTSLLGSACSIGAQDYVGNHVRNYVYLDVPAYLREPYLIARRGVNREYFWNDLLKSSLFGTHNRSPDAATSYALNRAIASWLGGLLLILVAYGLIAVWTIERERSWILVLKIVVSIAFLMGFRVLIPAPHHNDFRHVFSMLPPAAILFALGCECVGARRPILGWIGRITAVVFLALSVVYFVPKYRLAMALSRRTIHLPLASRGAVVREGTDWDDPRNLTFELSDTLELTTAAPVTVRWLDTSLDGNDAYEVVLHGARESRRLVFGPPVPPAVGLARYRAPIIPPVEDVDRIEVRALSGDYAYALGHLIVR